MPPTIRPAGPADGRHLPGLLALALDWRPGTPVRPTADVLADPMLARYVVGWPRDGDLGVIADRDDAVLGAAWLRTHPASVPSYGFVDEDTPELAIAIVHGHRGEGLGSTLIDALLTRAREAGIAQVSLSVNRENPARRLYERVGFVEVERVDDSATMLLRL